MLKLKNLAILALMIILLAGCSSVQNYKTAVSSWIGASADKLYAVWGYPTKILNLPNGNKVFVYRSHWTGSTTESTTTYSGGQSINEDHTVKHHHSCSTQFEKIRLMPRLLGTSISRVILSTGKMV